MQGQRIAPAALVIAAGVAAYVIASSTPALATVDETQQWNDNSCYTYAVLSPAVVASGEPMQLSVSVSCDYHDFASQLDLQMGDATGWPVQPSSGTLFDRPNCSGVNFTSSGYLQPWTATATCSFSDPQPGLVIATYSFTTLVPGAANIAPPADVSWTDTHCSWAPAGDGITQCSGQFEGLTT